MNSKQYTDAAQDYAEVMGIDRDTVVSFLVTTDTARFEVVAHDKDGKRHKPVKTVWIEIERESDEK